MANTTWDPATNIAVTLSGGNLVATNTGTTSTNQGAKIPATDAKATGKYYFEFTLTTLTGGGGVGVGMGPPANAYSTMSTLPTNGAMAYLGTGNIWAGSGNSGYSLGARANGDVIGVAYDAVNNKVWFRLAPSGTWQPAGGDPTNPANGYFAVAAGSIPFVTFGSGLVNPPGVAGNVITANFGGSAFSGAAPSGYTVGWPSAAAAAVAQARAWVLA